MPTLTDNLSLKKPSQNETIDVDVLNENFDIIDESISEMSNNLTGLNALISQKIDIVFGTYTGNAPEDYEDNTIYSQTINLGFTPKAVVVYQDGYNMYIRHSTYSSFFGGLALEGHPTDPNQRQGRHTVEIVTNGFKVLTYSSSTGGGLFANSHGDTYYFIAFKNGQIVEK